MTTTAVRRATAARSGPRRTTPHGPLAGTGRLLRLALRTDRWTTGIWAVAVAGMTQVSVVALAELYAPPGEREARAALIASPAATALAGPGFGLDDYTLGAMTANELALWLMLPVGIMGVLAVSRHLRAPEEDGRLEIVRSQPVGRAAPVVAGLLAAATGVLVVGALLLVALLTTDLDPGGSVLMVASVVVVALVLASATAVAAQLTTHARTSSAIGMALLGLAFVLRAVGDVQGPRSTSVWTWLSPFGWSQATAPYTLDRWWPLAVGVAAVAVNVGVAAVLVRRRDLGTGLLPERLGPARGRVGGLVGLTWRRQRTSVLAWGAGVVGTGALIGLLASAVVDFVAEGSELAVILGDVDDAVAAAFGLYVVFIAVVAAAYVGTAVGAARAEERSGRAAGLLALPVSRVRWLGAQVGLAAVAATVMLLLAGVVMGAGAASTLDDASQVGRLLGAAAVTVPGVLLVLGVATALLGLLPRATGAVWLYVAYVGTVGLFGELLPDGVDALSPFTHLPALPAAPMDWPPVLGVTAVAALLVVAGLAGVRRRDVDG
ncbi:ABC transporter permease [Cellulomonas wangsupingiae]|uniref:Anibiotic ABC transporter n=1 Tax=Cellulomonas wangsupingiae TaxID=2968085 RepID=A0ABY5K5S5_9CELL|nr:anibiotic ABC transporter [Cellulomonas wangsupingiae]MCC2336316.1 anibiotic ABC transporter [Cellulomonas wangsupingiae]UUI65705.1 anibiotic ABC transporter [Cellulomonas wangsupingiae]